jgi:C4-dicarboxylate-specific signal transduction histidine kinase
MQGAGRAAGRCIHEKDLEQLFFALAQNAIQAADGQQSRRFTILGRREGELVALEFSTIAGGLPRKPAPYFRTVLHDKAAGEGTGLGLCIAQRVVAQARGQMSVESHYGSGTTFRVSLPISGA